jgi:GTP-binding protein EngB required for normal cell division
VRLDLDRRLTALADAAHLADGRLDAGAVDAARAVTRKAGARLGLGIETTVVALAGPTGGGKSLLFNALSGGDLAAVGRRRPTTSEGQAASWGDGADPLLDWLGIRRRHRVQGEALQGLVLLDLPDFDSIETSHRLEVDRVVELVDLVAWVVEPQKYADASLHDRYLRPLSTHGEAMAVVLNQADLLSPSEVAAWRKDAVALLEADGLPTVPVLVTSARTGAGLDDVRQLLARRVATRDAAVARLSADVTAAAHELLRLCGQTPPPGVRSADRAGLVGGLSEAAGVPRVVEAVRAAHRHRGSLATGWLFVRWLGRRRPDPLRRLRLGDPESTGRTSVPPATQVQRAQVATAARALADGASAGLPEPWPTLVRDAATATEGRVVDRLDAAVGTAEIEADAPRWWRLASLVQWLLALVAVAGAGWIALSGAAGYLRIDEVVPLPELAGAPIPTWLLLGGLGGGLVLSFIATLANGAGAGRRARAAQRALTPKIESVADALVVAPVEGELDVYERLRRALETASTEQARLRDRLGASRRSPPAARSGATR